MPALKKTLSLFMSPAQLQHFSLRTYFLRKYQLLGNTLLIVMSLLSCIIIKRLFFYETGNSVNWQGINKKISGQAGHHHSNAQPNPAG